MWTLIVGDVGAQEAEWAALEQARVLIRQGLLSRAEEVLALPRHSTGSAQRGRAELLLGNIAYERGHFEQSRSQYALAEQLLAAEGQAAEQARANLILAQEQLDRRARLEGAVSRVRWAVAILIGGAVVVVGLLRSRSG